MARGRFFNKVPLSPDIKNIGFFYLLTFFRFYVSSMDPSKSGCVGKCGFSGSNYLLSAHLMQLVDEYGDGWKCH